MGNSETVSAPDLIKRSITAVLILFIVVIVYFSGPSTAFYTTANPSMTHKPGTRDINISVTFYKERYEAIGTVHARLMKLPTNATTTDVAKLQSDPTSMLTTTFNNDVNCWAAAYSTTQPTIGNGRAYDNTSFYSYDLNAYYTPNAPSGNFAPGSGFDQNFDIFAYGYVWNPWVRTDNTATIAAGDTATIWRMPGDVNFAYKFLDWSNDSGFSYDPTEGVNIADRATKVTYFGYYGYGYNYAGKFTCVFKFTNLPEGIYVSVVPYINGLAVDNTGFNRAGLGSSGPSNGTSSIVAIKDVNSQTSGCGTSNVLCTTDLNLMDPNSVKRVSFTIPRASTDANSTINFITIDINAESVANPSGGDMNLGKSSGPPRFTFAAGNSSGNPVPAFTLSSAATLNLFYTGFITAAEETTMISQLKIFTLKNGTWTMIQPTFSDSGGAADQNKMTTTITEFI